MVYLRVIANNKTCKYQKSILKFILLSFFILFILTSDITFRLTLMKYISKKDWEGLFRTVIFMELS